MSSILIWNRAYNQYRILIKINCLFFFQTNKKNDKETRDQNNNNNKQSRKCSIYFFYKLTKLHCNKSLLRATDSWNISWLKCIGNLLHPISMRPTMFRFPCIWSIMTGSAICLLTWNNDYVNRLHFFVLFT